METQRLLHRIRPWSKRDEKGRTRRAVVATKRSGYIKGHVGDRISQFYGLGRASPEKRDSWFLAHKKDSLPWARFSYPCLGCELVRGDSKN